MRNEDTGLAEKYDQIFSDYEEKGYLVKLNGVDAQLARKDGGFRPHFPVIRNDKSTTREDLKKIKYGKSNDRH